MSDFELLNNINDIDDDLICEAEQWKPRKAKKLKIAFIAAAAAALCAVTAVTAVASLKPPVDITVNDEPVEVEYTVYTDDKGREVRTYAYTLPDYVLKEEKEGYTAVGQVRVVARDDNRWGGWDIVDEEGNVFHWGINNKIVECEIDVGHLNEIGFGCMNVRDGYNMIWFNNDNDKDKWYDKKELYIIPEGDEETHKRLCEEHGVPYYPFTDPFADDEE